MTDIAGLVERLRRPKHSGRNIAWGGAAFMTEADEHQLFADAKAAATELEAAHRRIGELQAQVTAEHNGGTFAIGHFKARAEAAEAREATLRAALEPFAGKRLPSTAKTEIAFDEHGLRRAISRRELAVQNARTALKEKGDANG